MLTPISESARALRKSVRHPGNAGLYALIQLVVEALKRRSGLINFVGHTFYVRSLDQRSVVVDLGANAGLFACALATDLRLTCYALEAIMLIFRRIPNVHGVKKYNLAISNRNGPIQLFVSENPEANSIDHSIAASHGPTSIETCSGVTLQQFLKNERIDRVDLLKVDIEGAEDLLFDSTSDYTLRRIYQITIEFHDSIPGSISSDKVERIWRRLESLGFYCIPFSYMVPKAKNTDLLFIQCDKCNVSLSERAYFSALGAVLRLERTKSTLRSKLKFKAAEQLVTPPAS